MYIKIEIPEIKEFPNGFLGYWTNFVFIGSVSSNRRVNALTTTYIRLVEAALVEYRLAQLPLKEFWDTHSSIKISAMHRSIAHLEACITDMHRAIRCFTWLRNNEMVPEGLRILLCTEKPTFITDKIAGRLRKVRDAIHHMEERFMNENIPEGASFTLYPDGSETPIDGEPGHTLKKIDRLKIGTMEIMFSELAEWLIEMGRYAEKISEYKQAPDKP